MIEYWSTIKEAFILLVKATIICHSYVFTNDAILSGKLSKLKVFKKGIFIIIFISCLTAARLGTHTEQDDEGPYSQVETVVDFEPTDSERIQKGFLVFLVLFTPMMFSLITTDTPTKN